MSQVDQLLQRLYYEPSTGFINARALYQKAKAIDKRITQKQVAQWYKTRDDIQQDSIQKPKFQQFKIASRNPNEWQIDLAFVKRQVILIAVNINSRIGYAKILPNKQAATVQKAIDQFVKQHDVTALMSDNGSEFTNNRVESYLKDQNITHGNALPGDHSVLGKIDRFVRTIKLRLSKSRAKLTQRLLNDVIANYNSTEHSAINATPNEMKGRVMFNELDHNKRVVDQVKSGLPIGSTVRYKLKSNVFDKESAKYSKTVYEVVGLNGLKMQIKSKNGHTLYRPVNDLKLVQSEVTSAQTFGNENIHEATRILEHKKLRNGKMRYLVEWSDGDKTWEPESNLRLFNKNEQSDLERSYWSAFN